MSTSHQLDSALRLQNISIGFDGVSVLKDVSFTLANNEIHALVGKNGSGKSTLMKILSGVYTSDNGNITILGKTVKTGQSDVMLKQGLSMVYQDLSLIPSMTVTQNVFLCAHPYKKLGLLQDKKAKEKVLTIFETMGIDFISPDSLLQDLSVGEAQLVEIAKAMASHPKIIIFDEPTASLSDIETAQLFKIIRTLKSNGLSVIYITHYLEDVMNLCDRVTVLRDGKTVFTKATANTSVDVIVEMMLGDDGTSLKKGKQIRDKEKGELVLQVKNASTANIGPINLSAYAGEIVGLAGLLGSGRTEILRMFYGLDVLTSGTVEIKGRSVKLAHPDDAKRQGIALVPEERRTQGLVLDFSIEHNLSLTILEKLKGFLLLDSGKLFKIARDTIANLQVKARNEKQHVRFLSGGNQQKIVFGKCLASEPSILLLDDPTFGVDVQAKIEIMKIIETFAKRGNTVIFVSSELAEIANFCDRTYIVKKKQITDERLNVSLTEEALLKAVQ